MTQRRADDAVDCCFGEVAHRNHRFSTGLNNASAATVDDGLHSFGGPLSVSERRYSTI